MAYYYYPGVPDHLPQADKDLIYSACKQHWTEIHPELAITEEARLIVERIEMDKAVREDCMEDAREYYREDYL